LHIEELHDLYCLPDIIGMTKLSRWDGQTMWQMWERRGGLFELHYWRVI